jgi:hypothetical protein
MACNWVRVLIIQVDWKITKEVKKKAWHRLAWTRTVYVQWKLPNMSSLGNAAWLQTGWDRLSCARWLLRPRTKLGAQDQERSIPFVHGRAKLRYAFCSKSKAFLCLALRLVPRNYGYAACSPIFFFLGPYHTPSVFLWKLGLHAIAFMLLGLLDSHARILPFVMHELRQSADA